MGWRNSKYLSFLDEGAKGKTHTWAVQSKTQGSILGKIGWYGSWRQFCFFPWPNTLFNPGCMEEICEFIREQMARRNNHEAQEEA